MAAAYAGVNPAVDTSGVTIYDSTLDVRREITVRNDDATNNAKVYITGQPLKSDGTVFDTLTPGTSERYIISPTYGVDGRASPVTVIVKAAASTIAIRWCTTA